MERLAHIYEDMDVFLLVFEFFSQTPRVLTVNLFCIYSSQLNQSLMSTILYVLFKL